ncbi:MAG: hypothetical protein ACPGXK_15120, partial [Phycisphaerae bacterium]
MAQTVNKIKNPDFGQGKSEPRNWTWSTDNGSVQAYRAKDSMGKDRGETFRGIRLLAEKRGTGLLEQSFRVRKDEHYRIEADVFCALAAADDAGFKMTVTFTDEDDDVLDTFETSYLQSVDRIRTLRAYLDVPPGAKTFHMSLGLHNAEGRASIEDIRVMRILELDLDGHALSVPPPPHQYKVSRVAETVTVCSEDADGRPLTELLQRYFGSEAVSTLAPSALRGGAVESDALFLPDSKIPGSIKSMPALLRLAEERIVVISLPAFQSLAEKDISIRTITQSDDPIHARIAYGDHMTHGFALNDVFPFAWRGKSRENFRQRQFSKISSLKEFCKKRGFEVFLDSMCDKDTTSEKPIGLFRLTERGALYVLDIEPVEVESSLFGEVNLAAHLLLAILGQTVSGLGQYSVPYENEGRLRGSMRDMSVRFSPVNTHDADLPEDEIREQLVTVGDVKQTFGLPVKTRDAIIIRSGLNVSDMESVYGPLLWLKQLVRMVPHECPYADAISSRYRIAWMPSVAPFMPRYGFDAAGDVPAAPIEIDTEDSGVAAMIDVVSVPSENIRVILATDDDRFARYQHFFPKLTASFAERPG